MIFKKFKYTYLLLFLVIISYAKNTKQEKKPILEQEKKIKTVRPGAFQTDLYFSKLKGKSVGVVANQTSVIVSKSTGQNGRKKHFTHLVDSLITRGIRVTKVFSPEHGFRGKADAGELVKNATDTRTGLPIISLYGKNKKPKTTQLQNIDVVLFDIQDVGVRFYTYISTLHYVMEACAEANIPLIVLDRPNPNAHYIDGPILNNKHKSFIGMHPVPVVYGMTIGEYAKMINGEKWLNNGIQCDITVISLKNYTHKTPYSLPIPPSPNLPNDKAINLYPSLCFFEGTNVSCGRGTAMQFQIYGSPYLKKTDFFFTPKPNQGAKHPKHQNKKCYGFDLRKTKRLSQLNLSWLINSYKQTSRVKTRFWRDFFTKLAGTEKLQQQIEQGVSIQKIRTSWQKDLVAFKKIREKYILY